MGFGKIVRCAATNKEIKISDSLGNFLQKYETFTSENEVFAKAVGATVLTLFKWTDSTTLEDLKTSTTPIILCHVPNQQEVKLRFFSSGQCFSDDITGHEAFVGGMNLNSLSTKDMIRALSAAMTFATSVMNPGDLTNSEVTPKLKVPSIQASSGIDTASSTATLSLSGTHSLTGHSSDFENDESTPLLNPGSDLHELQLKSITFKQWCRTGGLSQYICGSTSFPRPVVLLIFLMVIALCVLVYLQRKRYIFGGAPHAISGGNGTEPVERAFNVSVSDGFAPGPLPSQDCQETLAIAQYLLQYTGQFNITGLSISDLWSIVVYNGNLLNTTASAFIGGWGELRQCNGWSTDLQAMINNPFVNNVTLSELIELLQKERPGG